MFNPQIHYRTSFQVRKSGISTDPSVFQTVVNIVGSWLFRHGSKSDAKKNIFKTWLYRGGYWKSEHGAGAEVKVEEYDEESRMAPYWVFRYEHPDRDSPGRIWRTDIALTSKDLENGTLSVTVTWYLRSNYFGKEPQIPDNSIPKVVRQVLESDAIYSSVGTKRLQATAHQLRPGDGKMLYEYIINPNRVLPVVIININSSSGIIDPDGLQKLIIGSGIVFWYDDVNVYNELNYMWAANRDYQCAADTIRVYMPNVNIGKFGDLKRHRYFLLHEYKERSKELLRIITQNLFRLGAVNMDIYAVTNMESLAAYRQRKKLKALKESVNLEGGTKEEREYIEALEADNESAHEDLRNALAKAKEYEDQILDLEVKVEILESRETELKDQFGQFATQQAHFAEVTSRIDEIRSSWRSFPTKQDELLMLFKSLCPDKIVVLDEAMKSAKVAKFQYLEIGWNILMSTATVLHDLYFKNTSGNIERDFADQTGFELTLRESSATKSTPRLMALRKRAYDSQEIDISPHIKTEKGGKGLRLHYFPDHTKKAIVIGHFGDHLETAGTARRKENV